MAEALDGVGRLAEQQADQMLGAEPLAGAQNGGHRLLRRDGAVHHRHPAGADVAIAARRRIGLAEII